MFFLEPRLLSVRAEYFAVDQHAVRADKSIPVPTWSRPQVAGKLNSPQGGKVRYVDVTAGDQWPQAIFSSVISCHLQWLHR